jgi:hypothetical protein
MTPSLVHPDVPLLMANVWLPIPFVVAINDCCTICFFDAESAHIIAPRPQPGPVSMPPLAA